MAATSVNLPLMRPASTPRLARLRSDEVLVARFRAGDAGAYEAIVARYRDRLLSYAGHVLRGSDEAQDVVQDVFVRAHAALLRDDRPMILKPWLYRIAHNRCMDALRRAAPEELSSDEPAPTDVAQHAEARAAFGELLEDIGALPDQQRSALVIRELEGLSYDDLAATLDTTVAAVKSLLVRARINLAEAAEARAIACTSVHEKLAAPGRLDPATRRHLVGCRDCRARRASADPRAAAA